MLCQRPTRRKSHLLLSDDYDIYSSNQRRCITLAHGLGLSMIIPLTSFNQMFLTWAVDDAEAQGEVSLSDLDDCEDEGDEDGESNVRYITEEEYDR
jgi:hypothetical protein